MAVSQEKITSFTTGTPIAKELFAQRKEQFSKRKV
jgi:hypothetical protein